MVKISCCTDRACSFHPKYSRASSSIARVTCSVARVSSPVADRSVTVKRVVEYGSSVNCNLEYDFSHHLAEAS